MSNASVVYDIIARDKASRTFRKVADSAAGTERSMGKLGHAVAAAGMAFAGTAVAVGVASVKMAGEFQASMTKIQSMAGGSAKDVRVLSGEVLKLGTYAQQSPKELADSLYHLKSVGMDNVAAMKALRQSADLAAVGGNSLEETTNALAGAWRSGIKGAGDFRTSVATLNAIVGAGNMSMEDLTGAIGTGLLPSAKAFGVSLKQVGAALALMTDEGIPADAAATRLRMSLSLLAAPSGSAEKVLSGIGLSGHQLGETLRKKNGLIDTIQLLKDHLAGLNNYYPNQQAADAFVAKWKKTVDKLLKMKPSKLSGTQSQLIDQYGMAKQHEILSGGRLDPAEQAAVLSKAFGGGRSSSAILTLINNLDVLKKKQDQINGSTGRFGASVTAQRKTAEAQFKLLKSSLDVLAIKLGNELLPPVTAFVHFLDTNAMPVINTFINGMHNGTGMGGQFAHALGTVRTDAAGLFGVLKSIPVPVLLMATKALIAYAAYQKLSLVVGNASTALTGFIGKTTDSATRLEMLRTVTGRMAGMTALLVFAKTANSANDNLRILGGTASGALMGFARGGPLGAAIGAGIGFLAQLSRGSRSVANAQAAVKQSIQGVVDTLNQETGAITKATVAAARKSLADSGVYDAAKRMGVNLTDLTNAYLGNHAAAVKVGQEMQANYTKRMREGGSAVNGLNNDMTILNSTIGTANGTLSAAARHIREIQEAAGRGADFKIRVSYVIPKDIRNPNYKDPNSAIRPLIGPGSGTNGHSPRVTNFVHNGDIVAPHPRDYAKWNHQRSVRAGGGGVSWP